MRNIAASVRAKLTKIAREEGLVLDFMIERFAMGRLLWRLSQSPKANQFILKGAQLFTIWEKNPHRPTRDIDFLGFGDPSEAVVKTFFDQLLSTPSDPEDGLVWGKLTIRPIRDDQRYGGFRIDIPVSLAGTRVRIQIDIGFGDTITPAPEEHFWNELLEYPAAKIRTYPPETVVAEKLEAAVQLEIDNSRMKDFYDLDWLARNRSFDFKTLKKAITLTFECRGTELPQEVPFALTREFSSDATKQVQWKAFLRKNKLDGASLEELITRLNQFLLPLITDNSNLTTWNPKSGWSAQKP